MIDQTADKARGLRPAPLTRSRRPGRLWRVVAWTLVILLLLAGLAWIVWPRQAAQPARGGRFSTTGPMPVSVLAAEKGDVPITLNALGTVTPLATVTVKTQINGQLTRIAFQEGQQVERGDFLAEIDPRPYQAALDQAQGQLQRDQALLRNAEVDLQRYKTLAAQDSIARQQLDTQDALVRQYQGTVKADQAMVDNARINFGFCRIVAPVSGRVGLRQVDQGNYVQVSDAGGLVVITQLKPITVIFTLPEDNLSAVLKRLRAGATLQVTALDRGQKAKLAVGSLTTIDNQIDTTTGTFKLRAQFDNDDEALFPNQFVNIQLLVDVQRDSVVVPSSAIQRGAPGTFVYAVQPDSTVKVQPVALGPAAADRVAITSGLAQGDKVVVDGADKLRDGAKVMLPEEGAAAGGTSGPARRGRQAGQDGTPSPDGAQERGQGRRRSAQ
ncbi:MAG: MdtA/MuxA family multidrug efflux RND transporter periplasmic adaptor subunit [Proteobacteria bacterium]|nr:MdtA/MuxA family multidrug efflux RND transporter periplasmic adaptor subunit [Pseudomonadota bacterium]